MDALDLLEQQHRDVNGLIDRVATEPSAGRRSSLVADVVRAVEAHSRAEERAFYGTFSERIGGDDGRLYEAFELHAVLRFAAANLLRTRATDVRFVARLKLVRQLFARHAAIEEDWMFPKAKRSFGDEELDRIGLDVERTHAVRMHVGRSPLEPRRAPEGRAWIARPGRAERAGATHRPERREGASHR